MAKPLTADFPSIDFAARRKKVGDKTRALMAERGLALPAMLVLQATPEAVRQSDVEHPYRADSDLWYLTGLTESHMAVCLRVDDDGEHLTVFANKKDKKAEIWNGRRLGAEGAKAAAGADDAYVIGAFSKRLAKLLVGPSTVFAQFGRRSSDDARIFSAVNVARRTCRKKGVFPTVFIDAREVMGPIRLQKDAAELFRMKRAADATARGHIAAMQAVGPGGCELDLEATLTATFLKAGARRHGYNPIVAAGENACILHYVENDAAISTDDLVLIDAGAEVDGYTADVTRTFPASGKFSTAQRAVYDIVLDAQHKAIAHAGPGVPFESVNDVARRALCEGLIRLGALEGDVDELCKKGEDDEGNPTPAALDRFYPHGTGHYLGMDVHDVGPYHDGTDSRPLAPGTIITVEPGLYFQPDDEDAPEQYRGIGVRIEDDILITDTGTTNLTEKVPTDPDAIEALMAQGPSV